MDLNEITGEVINSHPWELSRTYCVLDSFSEYLDEEHRGNSARTYINAGSGDLYFDKALLQKYEQDQVYAIDIAYKDMTVDDRRIHKFHFLEEIQVKKVDYAIMMDSLEYMKDDVGYIRSMGKKMKEGGYFFFTLPAFPILFSDYDVNIRNLRRYSHKSFSEVLKNLPEFEKIEEYNFYSSLFMIRFVQKILHLPIDPKRKFTAGWKYARENFLTRFLTMCLDLDFKLNRMLGQLGIRLPGLSMLVVCRKI